MKVTQNGDDLESDDPSESKFKKAMMAEAKTAEANIAAEFLVEIMGEDIAVAFFARFGVVMADACRRAEDLAQVHRAESESEIEIPAVQVRRVGVISEGVSYKDKTRIEALAAKIERGEKLTPIVVMLRQQANSSQAYDVISGWDEFRAFVDVLSRVTVPVRIPPPIAPETLTLFDGLDA